MANTEKLDARPLYLQVREILTRRISSGVLGPGAALPSEFQIADDLGVSQGTVRKALDALAQERLVVRVQGKGTFVVEQTPEDVHFRFFNIFDSEGQRVLPGSRDTRITAGEATEEERRKLALPANSRVCRIRRIRVIEDRPFIVEKIVLSEKLFPDMAKRTDIPNTVYDLFQSEYGILVIRARDALSAEGCGADMAADLGVDPGTPLAVIDRIATTIGDAPVEWRVSWCHLDGLQYVADVE